MAKMTDTYKDWHKKLPFALHAYWTAYRMEAVLPIEVEIPSLQILMEAKLEEALIEEKRLKALCHGQL